MSPRTPPGPTVEKLSPPVGPTEKRPPKEIDFLQGLPLTNKHLNHPAVRQRIGGVTKID
jgi:hypothetical protein